METTGWEGECGMVRGWMWMGDVVWFVDGGIWGMCAFTDGGIWGMDDRSVGRIENGGNLNKLKQIWIHIKDHKYQQS